MWKSGYLSRKPNDRFFTSYGLFSPLEYEFVPIDLERLPQEFKKRDLTNPGKEATIRTSINYRCVPGKQEPAFAGLAEMQSPPHKQHGFRFLAHNPEVSGSNPLPGTKLSGSNPFVVRANLPLLGMSVI